MSYPAGFVLMEVEDIEKWGVRSKVCDNPKLMSLCADSCSGLCVCVCVCECVFFVFACGVFVFLCRMRNECSLLFCHADKFT